MSSPANKTMIGAFVLGALALAVAAVIVMGSGMLFTTVNNYVMFFQGSVNGLSVGAPVVFRGVQIGSVKHITIQANAETLDFSIPVVVSVEPDRITVEGRLSDDDKPPASEVLKRLIEKGLRAQLQLQSFVTGQLIINLDFMPDEQAHFHSGTDDMMEIPTVPSPMDELTKTLAKLPISEIMNKLLHTIDSVDKLLSSPEVTALPANLDGALTQATDLLRDVRAEIKPLVTRLDKTLGSYGDLANKVQGQVAPLARNIGETLQTYDDLGKTVDEQIRVLSSDISTSLKQLDEVLEQANQAVDDFSGSIDPKAAVMVDLRGTLNELSGAARAIRVWAEYLERHPEALIQGKGDYRR